MSRETMLTLNTLQLIGFTAKRGKFWHYREDLQGSEPNHYEGAIPIADVNRRLFNWSAAPRRVAVEVPADIETMTHLSDDGQPMRWSVQLDRQAINRDDTEVTLGLFKDGYQPHQYSEWLMNVMSNILGDTLSIGSAGLLRNGGVAYVQAEVDETRHTPEGVSFRPNLLSTTSFDGSLSTTYKRTITNVGCDNTHEIALAEDGQVFKIKHTRHSKVKISEARDALALIEGTGDEFAAEVAAFCATPVTDKQFTAFLEELSPTSKDNEALKGRALTMAANKQDTLRRLWTRDERVTPWKGTAWGVLQAVNTYTHHEQTVRGSGRAERNMLNAITGITAKADQEALKVLGKILTNA